MSATSPAHPVPAASLILLRQGVELEVLVGRRAADARTFPGATAFPGGKLEAQDAEWPGAADDPLAIAGYAALRETFEETGLLVAAGGEGAPEGGAGAGAEGVAPAAETPGGGAVLGQSAMPSRATLRIASAIGICTLP